MAHRQYQEEVVLSAEESTGAGTVINVRDYDTIMLSFASASSGNLTAKIQGAITISAPNFDSAATATNHWSYVESVDINNGDILDGSTGFAVSGTDAAITYDVNTSGLSFLTVNVTARSAGSITVIAGLFE